MGKRVEAEDLFLEETYPVKIAGKDMALRGSGVADSAWINKQFKGGTINLNPENPEQVEAFSKLIFMLLKDEYKPLFKSRTQAVYNEETEETEEVTLKPFQVLAKAIKPHEILDVAEALTKSMGVDLLSEEEAEDLIKRAEKKTKAMKAKAKTGRKSTTSSRQSTATP